MRTVYSARRPEVVRVGSALFLRDSQGKLYTLGNAPVRDAKMERYRVDSTTRYLDRIRFVFR